MVLKLDEIMVECTPINLLPSQRKLPWLKKDIRSETRKETLFSKRLATVLNSDLLTIESLACFAELKPTISKI